MMLQILHSASGSVQMTKDVQDDKIGCVDDDKIACVQDDRRDEFAVTVFRAVEIDGFEPTTPCLQSRCSSQLSYTPIAAAKVYKFS